MTDETTVWRALTALLRPVQAQGVVDYWSLGEQEAALVLLFFGPLAQDIHSRANVA